MAGGSVTRRPLRPREPTAPAPLCFSRSALAVARRPTRTGMPPAPRSCGHPCRRWHDVQVAGALDEAGEECDAGVVGEPDRPRHRLFGCTSRRLVRRLVAWSRLRQTCCGLLAFQEPFRETLLVGVCSLRSSLGG